MQPELPYLKVKGQMQRMSRFLSSSHCHTIKMVRPGVQQSNALAFEGQHVPMTAYAQKSNHGNMENSKLLNDKIKIQIKHLFRITDA